MEVKKVTIALIFILGLIIGAGCMEFKTASVEQKTLNKICSELNFGKRMVFVDHFGPQEEFDCALQKVIENEKN